MRRRVLIYYRYFGYTLGGGEYLPLTMIAEFQKTCDVTLALDWTEHFEDAVRKLGIPVDLSSLELVKVAPKNYHKTSSNVFESWIRSRKLRRLAKKADLCISLANMMDFGKSAHHVLISLDIGDAGFTDYVAGRCAPSFATRLARFATNRILRPLLGMRSRRAIITDPRERVYPNSKYVASLLEGYYGKFNCRVFYPPTLFDGHVDNPVRDPLSVLFIGRIAPFKRIAETIGIVERAREITGRNLTIRLAGRIGSDSYSASMKELAATRRWVEFTGDIYAEDKTRFLFSGTYAIHVPALEAFGISVTEYLKAGLVPIVVNGGGAKEIVDNPALTFDDFEGAARILARLVEDESFRTEQQRLCAERAKAFTREAYLRHQREIISGM